jgi:hypothetical protein
VTIGHDPETGAQQRRLVTGHTDVECQDRVGELTTTPLDENGTAPNDHQPAAAIDELTSPSAVPDLRPRAPMGEDPMIAAPGPIPLGRAAS